MSNFKLTLHRMGTEHKTDLDLPTKENELPWQRAGLQYTATGYGRKIPTAFMVWVGAKWRRVYCCVYSNSGTCYIGNIKDGNIIY